MSDFQGLPNDRSVARQSTPATGHRSSGQFGDSLGSVIVIAFLCLAPCVPTCAAEPPIVALTFSPDGATLVAGSKAGVAIYQWPELKRVGDLATVVDDVHDLAFSPDGQYLAIAGGEPTDAGMCDVLNWPDGKSLCRISGQDDVIYSVAWSADSKKIATGSMDSTVVVATLRTAVDTETPGGDSSNDHKRLTTLSRITLTGHSKGVLAVGFLAGSPSTLLSAGMDQSIRLWSLEGSDARLIRTFENHTAIVRGLAVRPMPPESLSVVASIGDDRTVRFWQPTIGRMMRFTKLDQATPLSCSWLPDGSHLAVACDDGHVRLIDPDTCEVTADVPAQSGWCYAVAVHPKTSQIAVGGPLGISKVVVDR